jgi:branched-chain amino acid aminotransferase
VLITAGPLPAPLPPAHLVTSTTVRRNEFSPLARIKSLNYLDAILARQEAAARGADDALLLSTRGQVAEASAANLFVLLDGALVTPPVEDGALPGVMRQVLLDAGAAERPLAPADLVGVEEIFLTNALGLRAVAGLDGRALPVVAGPAFRAALRLAEPT